MTGPEDHSNTRPISVAELLARNGTIGAPPVGGRRRKRRGDTDAVTVAELTGEIPIVSRDNVVENDATGIIPAVADEPAPSNGVGGHVDADEVDHEEVADQPAADHYDEDDHKDDSADEYEDDVDDDYADAVADYTAHVEQRDSEDDPLDFFAPPPRRPQY